jgi:hypothetical protein
MTDPQVTKDLTQIESFSKIFAAALVVLYLLGFIVVARYLSRYGVSSFSVLQLQYLVAGVWVVGPPVVLSLLLQVSQRFDQRAAPLIPGIGWRRVVITSILTSVPSLFIVLLAAIPNVLVNFNWAMGVKLFLFYAAMVACAQSLWLSLNATPEKETWLFNRSHGAPFYSALLFMAVLTYALWFSGRIYPLIPSSWGGGRPLTIAFIEGDRKMPDEIQKPDPAAKRSIPYKLLLSTDKYYVVVAPTPKELSVEVSRESVAGIVVLD